MATTKAAKAATTASAPRLHGSTLAGATAMHVLLVGPDQESNLSLGYLASSLRKAGHSAEIAPFNDASDAPEVLRLARGADVVGLSMCFQIRAPQFLRLAADIKKERPSTPIIAGGHFATCAASELMHDYPQLDVIVMHEGENTLVELCDKGRRMLAEAGQIAGVTYREDGEVRATMKRPILRELDALPAPDRSGPSRLVAGVPTAYIMGSRGCIRTCDYCCITTLHRVAPGPRFRQREPEKVVEELSDLYQTGVCDSLYSTTTTSSSPRPRRTSTGSIATTRP